MTDAVRPMDRYSSDVVVASLILTFFLSVAPGGPAPPFELPGRAGGTVALADFAGRPVVVHFWASWCGPCLEELPRLDALHGRIRDVGGVVLALSVDTERSRAEAVAKQLKLALPVLFDVEGRAASRWSPDAIPSTFLVRPDGTIDRSVDGVVDDAALRDLEARIRTLAKPR